MKYILYLILVEIAIVYLFCWLVGCKSTQDQQNLKEIRKFEKQTKIEILWFLNMEQQASTVLRLIVQKQEDCLTYGLVMLDATSI